MSKLIEKEEIYNLLENIFKKFSNGNIDFDREITVDFNNIKVKTNMSDYIFNYIASLNEIKSKNPNFVNFLQYIFYEIPNYNKVKWIDTSCIGNIKLSYHELKNNFKLLHKKEYIYDGKKDIFSIYFSNFCDYIFDTTNLNFIGVTFLSIFNEDEENGHSCVLISSLEDDDIVFYFYDPNGQCNFTYHLDFVSLISVYLFKKYQKKCRLLNLSGAKNFNIQSFLQHNYFKENNFEGYCFQYSIFFTYCLLQILYLVKSNNTTLKLQNIINHINDFFEKKSNVNTYYIIVAFSNYIKDMYITFLQKNNSKDEYKKILVKTNKIMLEYFNEFDNLEIKYDEQKEDEYQEQKQKTRHLHSELRKRKLLPNKLKFDFEECKEHDECLSKECKYGKCMPLSFNRKLEILENGKY